MQDEDAFWMVWNPGRSQPTHRHESRDAAVQEARRLARLNPGERFYVLAAEPIAWMPLPMPPTWVDVPKWKRDQYRAAIDAARGEGA